MLNMRIGEDLLQPDGSPVVLYPANGIVFAETYCLRNKKTDDAPAALYRTRGP